MVGAEIIRKALVLKSIANIEVPMLTQGRFAHDRILREARTLDRKLWTNG